MSAAPLHSAPSGSPIDRLLARLDGVRRTGPGRWIAKCPAHEDRRPSLSVREGDDGRALIYDFAGCSAVAVVAALGLDLADLFPPLERTTSSAPATRQRPPRLPASDALELVDQEALIVELIAGRIARGESLTEEFARDLEQAARRISAVRAAWIETAR